MADDWQDVASDDWEDAPPESKPLDIGYGEATMRGVEGFGRGVQDIAGAPFMGGADTYAAATEKGLAKVVPEWAGGMSSEDYQSVYGNRDVADLAKVYPEQRAEAQRRAPGAYFAGQMTGGGVMTAVPGGLVAGALASGALAAADAYGKQEGNVLDKIDSGIKSGALSAGLTWGGGRALEGAGMVASGAYNAAKPIVKRVFSKMRGISPETLEAYADKTTRELVDKVAEGSDSLEKGILETSENVASSVTQKRAKFVEDRLKAIDNEIVKAHSENKPVSIRGLLNTVAEEKSKLLPVTDVDINVINKLDALEQRLLALSDQNIKDLPAKDLIREVNPQASGYVGRFVEGGEVAAPYVSPTAKNAVKSTGKSMSYLPESQTIMSKTPGGPKDLSTFKTEAAGTIKEVDPIMGPRRNLSAENLNIKDASGRRITSAIDSPDKLVEVENLGVDPFVTASQLNKLRRGFNRESTGAFTSPAGKPLPGAESMDELANTARAGLDDISTNIRSENAKLSDLFDQEKALKRAGLQAQEVDPLKLRDFLAAGPKRAAAETKPAQALDEMLGTDLLQQRQVVRAASELNPQTWFSKYATGASLFPIGVSAAMAGAGADPQTTGTLGLVGTALAAPVFTKGMIKGAVRFDDMVRFVQSSPALKQYLAPLMNAAGRGAASQAAVQFSLMSQHPELRDAVNKMHDQEQP